MELRLNSVVAKGQNDTKEEIIKYINFAKRINASIKFVELYGNDNIKVGDIVTYTRDKEIITYRVININY